MGGKNGTGSIDQSRQELIVKFDIVAKYEVTLIHLLILIAYLVSFGQFISVPATVTTRNLTVEIRVIFTNNDKWGPK